MDAYPKAGDTTERSEDEERPNRIANTFGGLKLVDGEAPKHQSKTAKTPACYRRIEFGMDIEDYLDIAFPQILARRRFVVSHGYNAVRMGERVDALNESFERYALAAEEDVKHDVRSVFDTINAARRGADDAG